jgi:ABC-2 type transport system ATP-binding protein
VIHVQSLVKRFGDIVAVDDVSFDVPQGQIFGLLGPNGAGKSTIINMLVGVINPDSGTIQIDGGGNASNPNIRRKIGNSPQSIALYEDLTAEENLRFFGRLYGLRGKALKERVSWALNLAGLDERKNDQILTFSGGMNRRLNLVCSLVHDPPLVLLDEPTVGVDPQSRNLIFDKIEALRSSGHTIIYTTHYMEEAQRLCDVVAIIDHGKILDMGKVDDLIKRHGDAAVIEADIENPENLPPGFNGVIDGHHIRLESSQPLEEAARLTAQGIRFLTLHILRPDLESVFLKLTGRRIRD